MDLRLYEWDYPTYREFVEFLKDESDNKYRDFHSALVPNCEKEEILGIRMPRLRELAKEIAKGNVRSYLGVATSKLYEERMLRGIVTGLVKTRSFKEFAELCDNFVDQIDNWAICDCFCSGLKQVKKYRVEFFDYIQKYLESNNEWKNRVALVIMLDYYLDDEYINRVLERCDNAKNDAYYVSMARAWLIATAVAKCRDKTMAYLLNNSLDNATFNKAIQKCIESKRIDDETKAYLKTLKRK